ncbi:MAG: MarR family transcriptional regulator [Streptococcaceae bacterium]|jgi:DNA-binding MarR family transcriptional regulator|nr:MarR family transcriptional regulator [Streptococcaceae bacterium]
MSEQTNSLLHLFGKILRDPQFMMALRMEQASAKLRGNGERMGARGLLVKLWEKDGLTNSEISELLDIKPSSVTAQVKELESQGLVERKQDENDGRVSRVFLTEKGREAQNKGRETRNGMSEKIFESLTADEQVQLRDLLQKLADNQISAEWRDWSRADWKALPKEERDAIKQQIKDNMKDMRERLRNTDWTGFGGARGRGIGRPNGDFFDWVWGPQSEDEIDGWRERHFGDRMDNPWNFGHGGRGGRSKGRGRANKDDKENWEDF